MRLSSLLIVGVPFVAAAALSLVAAGFAVSAIEDGTEISVRQALDSQSMDWAEVQANGLQVILSGEAPSEAMRFQAISTVGGIVDAARVIDTMDVTPTADLAPPRFSAEILRNEGGVSIIGLVPASTERDTLVRGLNRVAFGEKIADLLETADYPAPRGWEDAMGFAVASLTRLPRSKVSVEAGRVAITAMTDSVEEKERLERELLASAPPGLRLALDLSAPRPVITPFTLRFIIDEDGGRFDACSAESDRSRSRLIRAAIEAGMDATGDCTIGMGVPSPNWARAGELSVAALAELGQGSVTISDADITLVAEVGTDPALFDRVVGELENELPAVFALAAVLPVPDEQGEAAIPEFTATLSPEGLVQLRGRLGDEALREMVDSYAKARFGSDAVHMATRIVPDLPMEWPVRVLAALEALSSLTNGAVTVTPDLVVVRGISEQEGASAEAARLLSDKLGQGALYELAITYRPPPEPVDTTPTPAECEAQIAAVQSADKITFEPGSATVSADSLEAINAIADILGECGQIRLEIQGHTDSQGRESMNQQLSQARAQSILNALRARRVLTSSFVAVGYGEAQPIADNDTEEGREANRRIEFRLIGSETEESASENTAEEATAADGEAPAEPESGSEPSGDTPVAEADQETAPEVSPSETTEPETPSEDGEEAQNEQN